MLESALARYGCPQIVNTDQGAQYTSEGFIEVLKRNDIRISMDGKGAWRDNILVERFWHSLKYEEVYLHAYESGRQAYQGIAGWIDFYNRERVHQSLEMTPNLRDHSHLKQAA